MKNANATAIKAATAAITTAAHKAADAYAAAAAGLAAVVKTQVALLEKAGLKPRQIAKVVHDALHGVRARVSVNKILLQAGLRLRGKRSDAGAIKTATDFLGGVLAAPKAAKKGGGGHTVDTLAALLASLPEEMVALAVEAAKTRRLSK